MVTSKNKRMLSAKNPMPNETAAGPQNSLNNDWRSEHELMTLQNKIVTAQTSRKNSKNSVKKLKETYS